MNLRNIFNKYESILVKMAAEREVKALEISQDISALVKNRLQNEGIGPDGNKFKLYSAGYAAKRKALGLPVDKRTHTFTGDMLKSTRPIVVESNDTRTVVEISASDRDNQDKINENSRIVKTNILSLTEEEKNLVEELNQERIDKYFR